MRKLTLGTAVCALALVTFGTGTAGARQTFDTQIYSLVYTSSPNGDLVAGVLESEKSKCEANRDMTISVPSSAKREPFILDATRSSDDGAWAFEVPQKLPTAPKVKVQKKELNSGDVCAGDSVILL